MSRRLTTVQLGKLSGEALRTEAKRADKELAKEIDRLRLLDPQFKDVIDYTLQVEDEQLRRKNA